MRAHKRRPILDRAMTKFIPEPNSGCWLWIGTLNFYGYGVLGRGGKGEGHAMAHRVIYEGLRGLIPDGLEIDHLCRVRSCVNPDHLEPVTRRENVRRGNAMKNGWWHLAKTHCPKGHPYDAANTRLKKRKSGGLTRTCRACDRIIEKRRRKVSL